MKTPCYDTVILSDLHLGSEVSRAEAASQMLKAVSFSRLILLGDIFCDLNFRRLKKEHWQFLSYIRKLVGIQNTPGRRITACELLLGLQIAICAVLVTSSLVALRGLLSSLHAHLGVEPENAMLVATDLSTAGYSGDRI